MTALTVAAMKAAMTGDPTMTVLKNVSSNMLMN